MPQGHHTIVDAGTEYHDAWGVAVTWSATEHVLTAVAKEFTRQPDGSVIFYAQEGSLCNVPTSDMEEADLFVGAYIKWDGCGDWVFGPDRDGGRVHFCDKQDIDRLAWAMGEIWRLAARHVPAWDGAEP